MIVIVIVVVLFFVVFRASVRFVFGVIVVVVVVIFIVFIVAVGEEWILIDVISHDGIDEFCWTAVE